MPAIKLKTPAKINLLLSILKRRLDNFHEVETIYQTINLFDIVTVEYIESDETNIKISSNDSTLPLDSSNLAYKAAEKFLNATSKKAFIKINLTKNIPKEAGLAGGSSNAACVLNALNKINFYPLEESIIKRLALSLGADVSFFLKGGAAIGKGIGDILEPIKPADLDIVLLKPKNISVSTPEAYNLYDELSIKPTPKRMFDIVNSMADNNVESISSNLFNSLEYAVFKVKPELKAYKDKLIELGCYSSLMTGSGSAVFGIAKDSEHAEYVKNNISDDSVDVWVLKTITSQTSIS
ncbi:MAG: 4-(cytidine 5'-diphospho)-2-C-methyl-D-erythritol kinase [Vampirovibrionia bacterium]